MHDKINLAIKTKVSPEIFLKILVEELNFDLEEVSKNIEFDKSLDVSSVNLTNTRRMETLNNFIIQKSKLLEIISEIELYLRILKDTL